MTQYKVYEVENKTSQKGNPYKKLVLQEDGAKFPIKNVTMFASHPLFEDIAPGQKVELEIETKDSETPNPHGGFYKNRTVINPGNTPRPQEVPKNPNPPTMNTDIVVGILNLKVLPTLAQIQRELITISEKIGMDYQEPEDDMDKPPF